MTLFAQHFQPLRTSQHPQLVMPSPGSTNGSQDVVDFNDDTNGTTAGPRGDIDDAAGTTPPPNN
jgi:hypothetical protein